MTKTAMAGDRRAQHLALAGFFLQSAAFVLLLGLALWQDSQLGATLARFLFPGIPIWFVMYLVLSQIRRVGLEALETKEIKRAQDAGNTQALFEVDNESLLLEQNRLTWMIRWLLPGCTVVVSLILLLGHFVGWNWTLEEAFDPTVLKPTSEPMLMMAFVIGVAFVCFLFARSVLALARLPGWRLLRAGAVFLVGAAMASVLVAFSLMATETYAWAEPTIAYLIRVVLIVLGFEMAVNLVLDMYRPRSPGEFPRPAFDSRLLGLISEPGGMAKSIAEAFNYQFGFQVSSTWFYQLLQRWLLPITGLGVAVIALLTSVVIVDADEQVVIERFGRLNAVEDSVLDPGLHFKWPFPIDIVHRVPVKRIGELVIGEPGDDDHAHEHEAILWTEPHEFVSEMMLLVASPKLEGMNRGGGFTGMQRGRAPVSESVAVSLLMVSVPIEYRVKDLLRYLYTYDDPVKLMEVIAYQYLSDYAASVDIDELIGPGREAFNEKLRGKLQDRLDELDSGIEVVFCGIRGAHPPAKDNVAASFQAVVSARTSMKAIINAAQGEAVRILTSLAGTQQRAFDLDEAIRVRDALSSDSKAYAAAEERVEALLAGDAKMGDAPISGEAAAMIADARANASVEMSRAAAKSLTFGTQVAAYTAAPLLYKHRKWLDNYEQLQDTRKYLIVGDRSNVVIEYDTAKAAGLDEVLSEGVQEERKKRLP
jgi:regulator of protease activity HflC (stomatin/prohibitin superfamily)